jgi:hypothetical protein
MENKQTAVEWLEENLIGNPHFESDFIYNRNTFKQAKAMEKEQEFETKLYWFGRGILASRENRIKELKPKKLIKYIKNQI